MNMQTAESGLTINLGFIIVTIGLYFLSMKIFSVRPRLLRFLAAMDFFWLITTALLGMSGFFSDFIAMPPRIPFFILGQTLFVVWVIFFSPFKKDLESLPQFKLISIQAFRIPVEILLLMLYLNHLLPKELTFHGHNFDIVTGVTALLVSYLVFKKGESRSRALIIGWNIMGMILVSIVVAHGMLSAPYPFQVLKLEPSNFIISRYPLIWLPMYLVPSAYFFHLVSLRKGICKILIQSFLIIENIRRKPADLK